MRVQPLLVVGLIALTGCATTAHRNLPIADSPGGVQPASDQSIHAATSAESITPDSGPRLLSLYLHDHNELTPPLWADASGLRLARAGDGISSPEVEADPAKSESLFSKDYWKLVGQDVKETFTASGHWETRDWLIAGGVVAGIGTVAVFDKDIQQAVQRNRNGKVDSVFNAVEPLGAEYSAGVLGAFYLGGEIFKDPRAKSVALDGLSASIIASGLVLQPLKYGIGRSRPGENRGAYSFQPFGGSDSFPSGHTTQAFAVATVIAEHYDSLWIKFGSYGLASMVGYARLNNNAHWTSDVLAGAAIGTFVGHVVVHFNRNHRNVALQPIIGPNMQGAQLLFSF